MNSVLSDPMSQPHLSLFDLLIFKFASYEKLISALKKPGNSPAREN